ncbi:MAG TPA: Plug domain-containing protein, partial [Polyangiales bacterium]|nr:Plug domain-containing protein [Polyangiales bacterium]
MPGTWTRRCCALGLTLALSCAVSAQEPPAADPPHVPVIEAPRLISVPAIVVPPDVALPEGGRVEVTITVGVDGSAALDRCEVDQVICDRVSEGLADAHFEPARRDGTPIAARVKVALQLPPPPSAAEPAAKNTPPSTTKPPPPSAATPSAPTENSEPLSYGAKAQAHPVQAGARRLELAEMRDLPGAFGDPFRAVDALPGVVPVLSGLPYFFIRGSPPAGTLYIYDDIPVPTLYHLAIGPAVIHPRMVGPITLYSGVAPARYGRLTGGV